MLLLQNHMLILDFGPTKIKTGDNMYSAIHICKFCQQEFVAKAKRQFTCYNSLCRRQQQHNHDVKARQTRRLLQPFKSPKLKKTHKNTKYCRWCHRPITGMNYFFCRACHKVVSMDTMEWNHQAIEW